MKRMLWVYLLVALLAATSQAEFFNLSPNMSLPVPQVGVEPGPQYADDVNNSLNIIDAHNHTPGSGVQVPSTGININADLPFGNKNLTTLRACRYTPQGSPLALAADLNETYVSGVDLYYNDGNGNQIRITQSGGVVGTPGSISGLVSPASATYSPGSTKFIWQSAANTSADMDFGSAIMRNDTVSSFAMTLAPHASLGANFTWTFPGANPGTSNALVLTDTSGNQSYLLEGTANQVLLMNSGGTSFGWTSNANFDGKAVQAGSKNIVVSNTNPTTNGLSIVRGGFNSTPSGSSCGSSLGEGFSCSFATGGGGSGLYTISFSTSFADIPSCTCACSLPNSCNCGISASSPPTTSGVLLFISSIVAGGNMTFICIGQRS